MLQRDRWEQAHRVFFDWRAAHRARQDAAPGSNRQAHGQGSGAGLPRDPRVGRGPAARAACLPRFSSLTRDQPWPFGASRRPANAWRRRSEATVAAKKDRLRTVARGSCTIAWAHREGSLQ